MPSVPEGPLASRALRRVGASLCGRYRIKALIGIGGMAAVYAGVHRNGHAVAIKILHDRLSADPEIERLFRREALLANKINHPGVVAVIDDDVSEDGCIFLVMPLLEGETLRARAERLGGKLPFAEVILVAHAMLEALGAAHLQKIVHRDIKPENVFLTYEGETRVLDFGIGRFFESTDPVSATRSGRAVGTPAFMAPEQALGRLREIDGRTDLWALGATMYTLLSGRLVHEAANGSEILVLAATRQPSPLRHVCPDIAPAICEVIDRALSFERAARWPDAPTMARALEEAASASLGAALSTIPRPLAPKPEKPADVHADVTRPPVGQKQLLLDEAPHATASPSGRGSTQAFRLAITRTLNLSDGPPKTRVWVALAASAAIVASGAVALRSTLRPGSSLGPAPQAARATDSIEKALLSSHSAWLDGDADRARKEAAKALELDPTSARAHLAAVVATRFWPDDSTRSHFMHAHELRDSLTASDAAYLEAMAPAMTVPADFGLSAHRLEELLERNQDDISVRVALADMRTRLGELDAAVHLLSTAAGARSPAGIVLGRYGALEALQDNVDLARTTLERCLTFLPGSAACAAPLTRLEMNEGHCAEAERILRKEISVSPKPGVYLDLAYTIERLGSPPEEVQPVLENWVRSSPDGDRPRNTVKARIRIHLMRGELREALSDYAELEPLIEQTNDDAEQFEYTEYRMLLEAELGKRDASKATLQRYVSKRQSFQREVDGGDNVTALLALGAEFGILPWQEWVTRRDDHLRHPQDRDIRLDGRARNWLDNFAIPSVTAAEAKEALDQLPQYLPILHRSDRWYWHDSALARVYALTGHDDNATPYLERATSSCGALEDLVQFSRAESDYADLLLRHGNADKACTLYGKVLNAWPTASGSVTSQHAMTQVAKFCANVQHREG